MIVIAGAIAACGGESRQPKNQHTVTLPANPPRAVTPPDLAVMNDSSKPSDRDGDGFLDLEDRCPDDSEPTKVIPRRVRHVTVAYVYQRRHFA